MERESGKFVRRFTMPTEIDPDTVRAEFKEGVLERDSSEGAAATPKLIDVKLA